MLSKIKIYNYRSFKNLELELRPLNVIIGPNGSGKTNFLDVFSLLSSGAKGAFTQAVNERGGFGSICFFGKGAVIKAIDEQKNLDLTIVFERKKQKRILFRLYFSEPKGNDKNNVYGFLISMEKKINTFVINMEKISKGGLLKSIVERNPNGVTFIDESLSSMFYNSLVNLKKTEQKNISLDSEFAISQVKDELKYPTAYKINKFFEEVSIYPPFEVSGDSLVRRPQVVRAGTRLVPSGANLFSVLYSIQQDHPEIWEEITETIQSIYKDFRKFTFPAAGGDGKIIMYLWEKPFQEFGFPPEMISDGTMRLLCLIAILKSPDPAPLICIDEPEIGLHPEWIKLVGELLEEASTRTQLIVATHSPELISKIKPENIIVCEKEDGATVMERLNEKELTTWLEKYTLGELWLSGHFGAK